MEFERSLLIVVIGFNLVLSISSLYSLGSLIIFIIALNVFALYYLIKSNKNGGLLSILALIANFILIVQNNYSIIVLLLYLAFMYVAFTLYQKGK